MQFLAHIPDKDIVNTSISNNQDFYGFGDAFEIFVRDVSRKTYYELHISPAGHWMQLKLPDREILKKKGFKVDSIKVPRLMFHFRVRVNRHGNYWEIYARIPLKNICPEHVSLEGRKWLVSFSRYDYTQGRRNPVLSSTSNHRIRDFHRQEDWHELHFT